MYSLFSPLCALVRVIGWRFPWFSALPGVCVSLVPDPGLQIPRFSHSFPHLRALVSGVGVAAGTV